VAPDAGFAADAGVAATARLAIEPLRDRPAEALPTPEHHVGVNRVHLNRFARVPVLANFADLLDAILVA
jgi:hypothetical protein